MALRIWCNPKYFPPEVQGVAVATAAALLAARGVTFEQVRAVQVHIDEVIDFPEATKASDEGAVLREWQSVWFDAIAAAEKAAGAVERTPIGAMWVLDESDHRFGTTAKSSRLR